MNKNTEYEIFAKSVYEELITQEGLTINVEHNKIIQGKAAKHQLDVYWEFKIAGVNHKVTIECKNYGSKVGIGKVRDFHSVLSDIGGINGIMVTTVGYQSGAKDYAEHYGIKLIVLREPKEEDWKGQVRYLNTTANVHEISVINSFVKLDLDWFIENFPSVSPETVNISFHGLNNEMFILDENGIQITNFLELENKLRSEVSSKSNSPHSFEFTNGFMKTEEFGNVKIESVELTYTTSISQWKHTYDRHSFTKALVKDISTGELKFIQK